MTENLIAFMKPVTMLAAVAIAIPQCAASACSSSQEPGPGLPTDTRFLGQESFGAGCLILPNRRQQMGGRLAVAAPRIGKHGRIFICDIASKTTIRCIDLEAYAGDLRPNLVELGDIDQDGRPDFAFATENDRLNTSSIWLVNSSRDPIQEVWSSAVDVGRSLIGWTSLASSDKKAAPRIVVVSQDRGGETKADIRALNAALEWSSIASIVIDGSGRIPCAPTCIRDMNGDGTADFAIAWVSSNHASRHDGSVITLYSGSTGTTVTSIPDRRNEPRWGARCVELRGGAVGKSLIAVSSLSVEPEVRPSRVAVLSLPSGEVVCEMERKSETFGCALVAVSDSDGDGIEDLAIGDGDGNELRGRVAVFSSRSGAVLRELDGRSGRIGFGRALSSSPTIPGRGQEVDSYLAIGSPTGDPLTMASVRVYRLPSYDVLWDCDSYDVLK